MAIMNVPEIWDQFVAPQHVNVSLSPFLWIVSELNDIIGGKHGNLLVPHPHHYHQLTARLDQSMSGSRIYLQS